MGRVYDINPDRGKGERGGPGWHCLIRGTPVVGVYRVELDDDADSGPATVHAIFFNGNSPVLNAERTDTVRVSFRHVVTMQYREPVPKSGPRLNTTIFESTAPAGALAKYECGIIEPAVCDQTGMADALAGIEPPVIVGG